MKKLGKKFLIGTAFAASITALVGCAPTDNGASNKVIDPTTEINVDVYGPPEESFDDSDTDANTIDEFDSSSEFNEAVYGPPPEETQ